MDSVCLLDLLVTTRDWHGGVLSVVTVDHGVRSGSNTDAAFVTELADQLGLPAHRADLEGLKPSEETLRRARYAVFEALDVEVIALAHHRDDQAETVLLQLLRGAGSRGLGAMRWKRDRYVRPLLDISREELWSWADHKKLTWREDQTNDDPSFLRNRLRAEVMPLLEDIRPGAAAALARSAGNLAEEDAFLQALGQSPPPWSLEWIQNTSPALVRRSLAAVLGSAGLVDAVLRIAAAGIGAVEIGRGRSVEVRRDELVLVDPPTSPAKAP